jgi:hypothetical protein
MHTVSNLLWPDTPFAADKRPFPHIVRLAAASAICWADDGRRAVPAAAALVYLPVRRHGVQPVDTDTLHVGYRVAVATHDTDPAAVAELVDGHLVQARRHAAIVAAAGWPDDAAALTKLATGPTPGITAVADAWPHRTEPAGRERGTALLVDADPTGAGLAALADEHRLSVPAGAGGLLPQADVQTLHDQLTDPDTPPVDGHDPRVQTLGVAALTQAVVVALLAGRHADRLSWTAPLDVAAVVGAVAWDEFDTVLGAPADTAAPVR